MHRNLLYAAGDTSTYPDMEDAAGPSAGPSRHAAVLLYDEDDRVEVIHATAGQVIRMDASLHERWKKTFEENQDLEEGRLIVDSEEEDEPTAFYPFASQLDWQVACWAVQEGIGHGALDRLLAIPGVSLLSRY